MSFKDDYLRQVEAEKVQQKEAEKVAEKARQKYSEKEVEGAHQKEGDGTQQSETATGTTGPQEASASSAGGATRVTDAHAPGEGDAQAVSLPEEAGGGARRKNEECGEAKQKRLKTLFDFGAVRQAPPPKPAAPSGPVTCAEGQSGGIAKGPPTREQLAAAAEARAKSLEASTAGL